jgi:Lrp/AsnC family transcriptional regulator
VKLQYFSARGVREKARDDPVHQARGGRHEQPGGEPQSRALVFEIALSHRTRVIQEPTLKHDPSSAEASFYLWFGEFFSQTIHQITLILGNYSKMPLDSVDIRILSLLQSDASYSISVIADAVHLSQNACWRRIKRLEEEGVIRKRVALLDPQKLNVGVTVFVNVRVGEHSEKWLETFTAAVRKMPEVVEFYRMAGDVDYLLKLQVADIPAYDRVYKSLIRTAKLMDVSAAFAMEEMKRTTELPLPRPR